LLAPFLSQRQRYILIAQGWTRTVLWWLKISCNITYEVHGAENLTTVPVAVIMSKHQSTWETMAFLGIFPQQSWVLKKQLLKIPLYGWGLAMLNPIAIDRKNIRQSLKEIVNQGKQRLENNYWVIIFPEGTRVAPRQIVRYTPSGGLLAVEAQVPIIPVAHNAGSYWRRDSWIKKPGVIQVVIGKPISAEHKTAQQITQETKTWIENQMAQLNEYP
jgi:1-acyl-sn-glycerol-3-phosphate acyltransferase